MSKNQSRAATMHRKTLGLLTATLLATAGLTGASAVLTAQPAEAATCHYSNLSDTRVKNVDCYRGAYAYKQSGKWYQAGSWVAAGNYSYNNKAQCFAHPGMIKKDK